jgi:hypothetical protein
MPIGRTNNVTGADQPTPGTALVFPTGSSPTQHASQLYFVRWKDEGESPYVLNDTRFRVKFVVLKITNEPRRLARLRLHAGKITTLKADLKLVKKEAWGESVEPRFQGLLEPGILSWFHDGWQSGFKPSDSTPEGAKESIAKMNQFIADPLNLLTYLRNETFDMLPVNRSAYLWLIYTLDKSPRFFHTTSGQQGRVPGKYELTIGISSADFDLKEHRYRLELRDWNDFTVTKD